MSYGLADYEYIVHGLFSDRVQNFGTYAQIVHFRDFENIRKLLQSEMGIGDRNITRRLLPPTISVDSIPNCISWNAVTLLSDPTYFSHIRISFLSRSLAITTVSLHSNTNCAEVKTYTRPTTPDSRRSPDNGQ